MLSRRTAMRGLMIGAVCAVAAPRLMSFAPHGAAPVPVHVTGVIADARIENGRETLFILADGEPGGGGIGAQWRADAGDAWRNARGGLGQGVFAVGTRVGLVGHAIGDPAARRMTVARVEIGRLSLPTAR